MALEQTSPAVTKAVGVLMELNTSQRRRMIAESREKARRDERARMKGAYTSGIEEGLVRGKEEGRVQGKEEGLLLGEKKGLMLGAKQEKIEIARNALQRGLSVDMVREITGLSVEEIGRLC